MPSSYQNLVQMHQAKFGVRFPKITGLAKSHQAEEESMDSSWYSSKLSYKQGYKCTLLELGPFSFFTSFLNLHTHLHTSPHEFSSHIAPSLPSTPPSTAPSVVVIAIRAVRYALGGAGAAEQGVIRLTRHPSSTYRRCAIMKVNVLGTRQVVGPAGAALAPCRGDAHRARADREAVASGKASR